MKREDFKKIIRLRSFWKIDRRKGNYKLPNGETLKDYIRRLVESQMELDNLGIMENGDLCLMWGGEWNIDSKNYNDYILCTPFQDNEKCSSDKMERRITNLILEIIC